MLRIGDVVVEYADDPANAGRKLENRIGLHVTEDSSLGKLCRAYIANGGNPLDISPFMKPDSNVSTGQDAQGNPLTQEVYPHGGVAAPMSADVNEPYTDGNQSGFSGHPGGFVRMDSYYPGRLGGRVDPGAYNYDGVVQAMHHMRNWARQDIDERLRRIEWQIIKLCDLREQLHQESDEVLQQAFGGAVTGLTALDTTMFNPALLVQNIVQEIYDLLYNTGPDGVTVFSPNVLTVPNLQFALVDLPSEMNHRLGG
jgi:hypothetical protein